MLGMVVSIHGSVQITLGATVLLCALVFFASCMDAIAGGGGLISLPAYLLTGLPPAVASGSNKFSACFGTMMATGRFLHSGKMAKGLGLVAVMGALPGSYLGAELLKRTPEQFVRIFMLVAIPLVAVLLLIKRDAPSKVGLLANTPRITCLGIGLFCGFYDGFFGPGTGTILIILFTYIMGMDMVTASGTAKLVNLASNLAAMVSFVSGGQVAYALAVPAVACSVVGGYLGAKMAIGGGAKVVRLVMLGVLCLLIAKLAWDLIGGALR